MQKALIILFFVSNIVFSQETITKNLGDFHELKTYRGLNIELIKSDKAKIEIEGNKSKRSFNKEYRWCFKDIFKSTGIFFVQRS